MTDPVFDKIALLQIQQFGADTEAIIQSASNPGFPSSFPSVLLSAWVTVLGTNASPSAPFLVFRLFDPSTGAEYLEIEFDSGLISVWPSLLGLQIGHETLNNPGLTPGAFVNVLIAVDTPSKTIQCFVNDVQYNLTSEVVWFQTVPMVSTATTTFVLLVADAPGGQQICLGDLWFTSQSGLTDLTVEANRRKFINADLTPVDLGANGELPFGTPPAVFLHVPHGGSPSDFLTNRGSGGGLLSYSAVGSGIPIGFGTCTAPPPPPNATLAELFFASTASFVDLSATAARRKFISGLGGAPSLGTDGSLPLSVTPPVFLSAASGNPDQFAANDGRGGSFTITGALVAGDSDPPPVGSSTTTPNPGSPGHGVLGDYRTGNLYAFNPNTLTDHGTPRRWLRRWRALPVSSTAAERFSWLAVSLMTGVGVPDAPSSTQTTAGVAPPQVTGWPYGWTVLPPLPGDPWAWAYDVSADGSKVVGFSPSGNAVYWTAPGIVTALGSGMGQATGISADGTVIVGFGNDGSVWRWTAPTGFTTVSAGPAGCNGISRDGSTIIGSVVTSTTPQLSLAAYWTSAGQTIIGALPGHNTSNTQRVSDDGSVIVGWSRTAFSNPPDFRAFRWTQAGGMVDLGLPAGTTAARAFGVSGDGAVVSGSAAYPPTGQDIAFKWTQAGGAVALPFLSTVDPISDGSAVTPDGSTICGNAYNDNFQSVAVLWTAAGITALPQFAADPAFPDIFADLFMTNMTGDASIIIGYTLENVTGGLLYHVPPPPPPPPPPLSVPYPPSGPPYVMLRWSDDGGRTWSDTRIVGVGQRGDTNHMVKFNRLGATRRNKWTDRIFELSSTDPFLIAILSAAVDVT